LGVAQEVIAVINKAPKCAPSVEVNKMRIICDQCNQPISGTVKRVTGHFNLHPHCVTQFAGELNTARLSIRSGFQSSNRNLVSLKINPLASSKGIDRAS